MNGGGPQDGLHPNWFGPPTWFVMHVIASNFPLNNTKEDQLLKLKYKLFFISLLNILPCLDCRINAAPLIKKIEQMEFATLSRIQLQKLIFDLHNITNQKLNKKVLPLNAFESIIQFYEQGRTNEKNCYGINLKLYKL